MLVLRSDLPTKIFMAVQQVVPVGCPNCGAKFNAPINNIINGQDIAVKMAFLQGQLNLVQCPQCRAVNPLTMPLLYYDLEKELALVYVPQELNLALAQQEKTIGDLTNALMKQLEPEQKKFYLFNPKTFLTLESLGNAVLEADGITPEIRAKQEAKAKLLQKILQAQDEESLKQEIEANKAELDSDFFEFMTSTMQAAYMEGNQQLVQALVNLRTILANSVTDGAKIVKEIDKKFGLIILEGREDLLERLQNAPSDEYFEELVATGHGYLDYIFFQLLTAQIDEATEAGNTTQAESLRTLRTKILQLKEQQEQQTQEALQKSTEILKEIFKIGNPEKVLSENLDQIDENFFMVLSAHIQQARQQKQEQAVQTLETIGHMAMHMLQEAQMKEQQKKMPSKPAPKSEILTAKR